MTARYEMHDYEIEQFNNAQAAKIISIKQKRMEKAKAKKIALNNFISLVQSIFIVLAIAGLFSVTIYQNVKVNEAKYNIFNLKAEIKSLNAEIEELTANIENQTGLKNIEKIAIETLGMKYPSKEQIVYIDAAYTYALGSTTPEIIIEPVLKRETHTPLMKQIVSALFNTKND